MASIRRTDILHKGFSKGRPVKTERERNKRRQEAYKWRDARRIYLANSFDMWRKLRSSLGMKDSGLAWHLIEAHEKGQCGICQRDKLEESGQSALGLKKEAEDFLPSVIARVKELCHSHFDFEESIQIVGLLCLEFDHKRKENFSVNEVVRFGEGGSDGGTPKPRIKSDSELSSCHQVDEMLSMEKNDSCLKSEAVESDSGETKLSHDDSHIDSEPKGSPDIADVPSTSALLSPPDSDIDRQTSLSADSKCQSSSSSSHTELCTDQLESPTAHNNSFHYESEAETSLEIDVEKMDTSQEDSCVEPSETTASHCHKEETDKTNIAVKPEVMESDIITTTTTTENPSLSSCDTLSEEPPSLHMSSPSSPSSPSLLPSAHIVSSYASPNFVPNNSDSATEFQPASSPSTDAPLDMTLLKTHSNNNADADSQRSSSEAQEASPLESSFSLPLTGDLPSPSAKLKDSQEKVKDDQLEAPLSLQVEAPVARIPVKVKEEGHSTIPWQRRDMSRKEEYEFLELNPFSDLAEFSQRYPHVHQRTYYRWKRRIKEEYIVLEQCPDMGFDQFSGIVLQAKESVFRLWKGLIAQGKGFFAPSDGHKRLESKPTPTKPAAAFNIEYDFLQKNMSATKEQFSRVFPGTPVDVFVALKSKVLQDFWVFYQNQHMSWKELSKVISITEDVYNSWKEFVELLRLNTLPAELKTLMGNFPPQNQVFPPSFPPFHDTSLASSAIHNQSGKDSFSNLMKECFSSQALKDSVGGGLSASYLASLQNMMLPWAGYYGIPSALSQQMVPMMLWPRMMGLAGSMASPLSMSSAMSVSPSSAVSSASPISDITNSASRAFENGSLSSSHTSLEAHNENMSKKRPTSNSILDAKEQNFAEVESCKKPKLKEDCDSPVGAFSRSRKQNKQEYIFYLKKPELGFKELEALFPSISLRTFYRWRKEMNAAVLFIEDNKALTFHQFKQVFPDIPEDVFDSWRRKSDGGALDLHTSPRQAEILSRPIMDMNPDSFAKKESLLRSNRLEASLNAANQQYYSHADKGRHQPSQPSGIDTEKAEAWAFFKVNPDVEAASFFQHFPQVPAQTLYDWRREAKDALDLTVVNGKSEGSVPSSVSPYSLDLDGKQFDKDHEADKSGPPNRPLIRKGNGPEFWFLQLNPNIDFAQFNRTYPDVPSRTFYRWKREIHQIIGYIRAEPSLKFEDVAVFLPEVSEDAFLKWRDLIAQEPVEATKSKAVEQEMGMEESRTPSHHAHVDEETKNRMTKALLYLMNRPTQPYGEFSQEFSFVTEETFDLWLKRIKAVVVQISSNPGLDYKTFSTLITDIDEDIFDKWKKLTPLEVASIGEASQVPEDAEEVCGVQGEAELARLYCLKHPEVPFSVLESKYPNISESQFNEWMWKISQQVAFIKEHPEVSFHDFNAKLGPVPEEVYELWSHIATSVVSHIQGTPLDAMEKESHDISTQGNGDSQGQSPNEANPSLAKSPCPQDMTSSHCPTAMEGQEHESTLSRLKKFANANSLSWPPSEFSDISLELGHGGNRNQLPKGRQTHTPDSFASDHADMLDSVGDQVVNGGLSPANQEGASDNTIQPSFHPGAYRDNYLLGYPTSESESRASLSALIAMSSDNSHFTHQAVTPKKEALGSALSPALHFLQSPSAKKEKLPLSSSPSPNSSRWSQLPPRGREDEEVFSSQRQKKMSRAEYLFVKDNPDVDSQEFSRIFPGVSARTFYRWKKEIKTQISMT